MTTHTATRHCPVCRKALSGTGGTPTKAEVAAQVAVYRHQLNHSYAEVVAAGKKRLEGTK